MSINSSNVDPNSADSGVLGPLDLDRLEHGSQPIEPTTRVAEVENAGGEPDNSIAPPVEAEAGEAPEAPKPAKRAAKKSTARAADDTEKAVD